METTILAVQIVISILLGIVILLQGGGAGLGSTFSGGGIGGGASFRSRRGIEKLLLYVAGFLAVAYFVSSLANFLV